MSILLKINPNNILEKAKSIVSQAQFEILATMDLAEELKNPLPEDYFLLLQKKVSEGIILKRLAFGTKKESELFKKRFPVNDTNYSFNLVRGAYYKRMLLVDRKFLMFAKKIKGSQCFFYTDKKSIIQNYVSYFFKIENRN